MGIGYRLRQLRHNLAAGPLTDAARREVEAALSPAEAALFFRFSASDQWHSYRVFRTLQQAGERDLDLLAAALLHDIGKTRCRLSAWDRTVIVVGQALAPRKAAAWGAGSVDDWRRPFVVRAHHPAWGAEMAAAAGSRPGVVALIRRHQDPPGATGGEEDKLLSRLQWADNQN